MPITAEVYKVLYKNKSPLKAVNDLMLRKKKMEDYQVGVWRSFIEHISYKTKCI